LHVLPIHRNTYQHYVEVYNGVPLVVVAPFPPSPPSTIFGTPFLEFSIQQYSTMS